jgi:hypothetical protein
MAIATDYSQTINSAILNVAVPAVRQQFEQSFGRAQPH